MSTDKSEKSFPFPLFCSENDFSPWSNITLRLNMPVRGHVVAYICSSSNNFLFASLKYFASKLATALAIKIVPFNGFGK